MLIGAARRILRRPCKREIVWSQSQYFFLSTESPQKQKSMVELNDEHNNDNKHFETSWSPIEWIKVMLFGIIFGVFPVSLAINNIIGGLGTTQGWSA